AGYMGETGSPGTFAAKSTGNRIFFSQFTPTATGPVTYIHFVEFSADTAVRAGVFDADGNLLASSEEFVGENSKLGREVHGALNTPVCLEEGRSYYLGVWVGEGAWGGTAYGGSGNGTYYNSDRTSFPTTLNLPGDRESGRVSIRITVNNDQNVF
ncbi:MAG: hypothetical protein ABFR97_08535, partial [Thermodesulfobacteriota bacterium]